MVDAEVIAKVSGLGVLIGVEQQDHPIGIGGGGEWLAGCDVEEDVRGIVGDVHGIEVGCVLATYMDAGNYDYEVFLIKDAIIGHDALYTDQVETIFNALDLNTISYMLKIRKE